jgi:raffinose/stachyose/melibiose transport system permease protein
MTEKKSTFQKIISSRNFYILLLPTFILLIVFNYYPAFNALYHSFFKWDGITNPTFIGIQNFVDMFNDEMFTGSLLNLIIWVAANLLIALIFPLLAAELVFNLRNKKMQSVYKTLFVIPMVIPGVVQILLWMHLLEPNGMINRILILFGLESLTNCWLGSFDWAIWAIIFIGFPWISAFNFLIYLSGLQNIPSDVLDSTLMDGLTAMRRVLKIDLPYIAPQIRIVTVLSLIGSIQNFQTMLVLTDGGPGWSTLVPALYMFHNAFKFNNVGYGMAIGTFLFVIILFFTYLNFKLVKSDIEYKAG